MPTIKIVLNQGTVDHVRNLPPGWDWEAHDYERATVISSDERSLLLQAVRSSPVYAIYKPELEQAMMDAGLLTGEDHG